MRYEANRLDRMNGSMQGNAYGYEMAQAQTWNPNAFSNNNNFSAYGATGRMKSQTRGRSALPTVRTALVMMFAVSLICQRLGWTNSNFLLQTLTVVLGLLH